MNTSRVDIIIPVYNVEPYLRRCLNSVLKQTYKHWRAICIDDGSTDGCPAILEEYAAKDSRFMVVHQANGGLSHARNEGMAIADAEYIMFVDSDDFIHPQTLELAVKLIERDGTDMVSWYKDVIYINIQLRLMHKLKMNTINVRPWRIPFRCSLKLSKSVITDDALKHASDWRHPDIKYPIKHNYVWRHLFKRSLIKDIKFIKGLKYEDIPWWSELLVKPVKATITHLPLYYYYVNHKSISKATGGVERLMSQLKGLSYAQKLYEEAGNMERMRLWSRNIKWAILTGSSRALYKMGEGPQTDSLVKYITDLAKTGFFDDAIGTRENIAKELYYTVAKGLRPVKTD
ncbi:glycosyltransferase family 2 protein [Leyella stercorea]|uniref:glycosyltransferase family 2 protein n=1 Tax=Leyella stercorea TaxID=363265 RepID=UPI003AEFD306